MTTQEIIKRTKIASRELCTADTDTKNTALEKMYIKNLYNPISLEKYLDLLSFIITHLRPDIIIHRISGDAPKDLLIAPSWNSHKKLVLNGIDKLLKEKEQFQGIFYKKIDE